MTPYTYSAEDDGYIQICSLRTPRTMDPDTMLATKAIMESDRDTVKLFLQVYLEGRDGFNADDDLMFNTSKEYFAACGREYADDYVKRDLKTRFLFDDKDYMSGENYCFKGPVCGKWPSCLPSPARSRNPTSTT